jgi:hypothetical protein
MHIVFIVLGIIGASVSVAEACYLIPRLFWGV